MDDYELVIEGSGRRAATIWGIHGLGSGRRTRGQVTTCVTCKFYWTDIGGQARYGATQKADRMNGGPISERKGMGMTSACLRRSLLVAGTTRFAGT